MLRFLVCLRLDERSPIFSANYSFVSPLEVLVRYILLSATLYSHLLQRIRPLYFAGRLYNKENESLIGQSIRHKCPHRQTQSAQALDSIVCVLLALCYEELQPRGPRGVVLAGHSMSGESAPHGSVG